jgi:hypothetical protein
MDATYEIFRDLPEGPIWLESIEGFNHVTERLHTLNVAEPGHYYAYDIHDARFVVKLPCEPKSALSTVSPKTKAASTGHNVE